LAAPRPGAGKQLALDMGEDAALDRHDLAIIDQFGRPQFCTLPPDFGQAGHVAD
jgi:hypothetical protein